MKTKTVDGVGVLSIDEMGIILVSHVHDAQLTGEQARLLVEGSRALAEGRRVTILVDSTSVRSMSREAREVLSGRESTWNPLAVAILVSSQVSRVIASFFIRLGKPAYPVHIFTSTESARTWLSGFLQGSDKAEPVSTGKADRNA